MRVGRRQAIYIVAGWSSTVARRAHNPKVAGSNPVPATKWSRGVVVNMPACHAGDRRFDPVGTAISYKERTKQVVSYFLFVLTKTNKDSQTILRTTPKDFLYIQNLYNKEQRTL